VTRIPEIPKAYTQPNTGFVSCAGIMAHGIDAIVRMNTFPIVTASLETTRNQPRSMNSGAGYV
jgi:hypothetical protein